MVKTWVERGCYMIVLIDKYIPFLQGVFDNFAEVRFLEPEQFTPETVRSADALIIRTRTRCNAELLNGSNVKFIATATIGTDHIDLAYCQSIGIHVVSCPGCNAQAVCDYIEEVINESSNTPTPTIGIVGVGHVGSLVAKMAQRRGLQVVLSDPPLGLNADVTTCDIITFHTPLTKDGQYPTYHLCNTQFLARCKPDALIINAARGGIVDEQALLDSGRPFVIDTWENEPDINPEVLQHAKLASMHIAGYSIQGKRNASQMCMDALCEFFNQPNRTLAYQQFPQGDNAPGWLQRITDMLKKDPASFETLRKNYLLR